MPRLVPAASRALEILTLFLESEDGLSVPEVCQRLGVPKSTCHELVRTLEAHRFVAPTATAPHRFELGLAVFELGNAYAKRLDLWREARDIADDVAKRTEETVQVAILDGTESLYLVKVDSSHLVRLVSEVGARVPAHCTAGGKVLLAALSPSELATRYGGPSLPAMTPHSIRTLTQLEEELQRARENGYAMDSCESNDSVCCVAAPVYDRSARVVAALSVSTPTTRITDAWPEQLIEVVKRGASELSARIGYQAADD